LNKNNKNTTLENFKNFKLKKKKKHFATQPITHPWAHHLPSLGSSLPLHISLVQLITGSTIVVTANS